MLRRGLWHLTQLEMLDDVSSIMEDPPSSSPATYMDLFVKLQTLASVNSGRPVGAPMLEGWLNLIDDQCNSVSHQYASAPRGGKWLQRQHISANLTTLRSSVTHSTTLGHWVKVKPRVMTRCTSLLVRSTISNVLRQEPLFEATPRATIAPYVTQ